MNTLALFLLAFPVFAGRSSYGSIIPVALLWCLIYGIGWTIFWSGIGVCQVTKGLGAIVTLIGFVLMAVWVALSIMN